MPSQNYLNSAAAASLLEFDSSIPYHTFIKYLNLLRDGQVIANFNIILERNRVVFYGPPNRNNSRTVRGKVRLEVAGRLHVKEIMISLAGEFHLINDKVSISADDSSLHGTLFSTCILLANKRTLAPGVHDFYFEFLLPGDLPESMSSDLILCEYFLKAELVSRCSDDLPAAKNKLVDVVDLTVQRAMLQSDEFIKQGLGTTRYTGSRDKILDYEIILPRIMRLDADTFTFHARWDGLRVDNVKFWFVQIESFKGFQSKDSVQDSFIDLDHKSKILSGPFCFDIPKKEPLKLQSRPMIFQLPITESLVRDYDLNNFEIRHKLIISIQMANKNKEIIPLSVPIMIESIVTDIEMTPPPCNVNHNNREALFHFANKVYTSKSIVDDNNNQQKSSSLKRFVQTERRKNTTMIDHSNESTTIVISSNGSNDRTSFQFPLRTSSVSVIRNRNNNVKNSISTIIESASEYTIDESSNAHTVATTATYTNNTEHERTAQSFAHKGSHKSTFVINSGIANRFSHLLHRRSVKKQRPTRASSASTAVISNMNPNASNVNNTSLTT